MAFRSDKARMPGASDGDDDGVRVVGFALKAAGQAEGGCAGLLLFANIFV